MSRSSDPAKQAEIAAQRALAESELSAVKLTDAEVAEHVGTVMLSVVRDAAISGHFAKQWHRTQAIPAPEDVFSPAFATHIRRDLSNLAAVQHLAFPLYGNLGDALGMLARLLVCCRDIDQLKDLVAAADKRIMDMGLDIEHLADDRVIHHLRNAVVHSNFKVLVDHNDPFKSKFLFLDVHPSGSKVTAKIAMSNKQLVDVIQILVHEVFEKYLMRLPNGKRWVVAP